jgi:hypothetical protein
MTNKIHKNIDKFFVEKLYIYSIIVDAKLYIHLYNVIFNNYIIHQFTYFSHKTSASRKACVIATFFEYFLREFLQVG